MRTIAIGALLAGCGGGAGGAGDEPVFAFDLRVWCEPAEACEEKRITEADWPAAAGYCLYHVEMGRPFFSVSATSCVQDRLSATDQMVFGALSDFDEQYLGDCATFDGDESAMTADLDCTSLELRDPELAVHVLVEGQLYAEDCYGAAGEIPPTRCD